MEEEVKAQVTQEVAQEQAKAVETPTENVEQINWRRFREQREIERKQKEEAEARAKQKEQEVSALKSAMDALLNKPAQPKQAEYEEESEDERIDKKVQLALAKKEQEYERKRQEMEVASLPQKLQQTYSDFQQVCTTENLDYLEFHYPEVAAGIKHMPESFERWSTIYKAVKRFIPNTDSRKDDAKMAKNLSKPQSPSASSTGTGDHAPMILDDKRKADNWARMQRILKGGS